ncbi:hypothetical protein BOX15_Mlig003637g1, partial [Macrostomum lignano]
QSQQNPVAQLPQAQPLPQFYPTKSARKCASLVSLCDPGQPLLVQGPVGCGKTSLVELLANEAGASLSKLQLGDQTDSKTLIGCYCCTPVPGQFVWKPGPLLSAVQSGSWLLLEDIDSAPPDLLSTLQPLIEHKSVYVSHYGESVTPADGFRLVVTRRLYQSLDGYSCAHNSFLSAGHWLMLRLDRIDAEDLAQIIQLNYPNAAPLTSKILEIFDLFQAADRDAPQSRHRRLVTTRDLLKFCSRLEASASAWRYPQAPDDGPAAPVEYNARAVFHEALDCFVAASAEFDERKAGALRLAQAVSLTREEALERLKGVALDVAETPNSVIIGRARLPRLDSRPSKQRQSGGGLALNRGTASLLERLAVCAKQGEPALLVGETGCGKSACVQYLANRLGRSLRVINLSQQTDPADLIGGYKPLQLRLIVKPVREQFELLFGQLFNADGSNDKFLTYVQLCFHSGRWSDLLQLMERPLASALRRLPGNADWLTLRDRLAQLRAQLLACEGANQATSFSFIEGALVEAIRSGHWVLLDEINLATPETLECLSGLLDRPDGSLVLTERGDSQPVPRHPDFRLFACMNPATDAGKHNLPIGVRNRFTELAFAEPDDDTDLAHLVSHYLAALSPSAAQVAGIVRFYRRVRLAADSTLCDASGLRPHFSLRSLCRALREAGRDAYRNAPRSLYEGFAFAFLAQLDKPSALAVERMIANDILGCQQLPTFQTPPRPIDDAGTQDGASRYILVENYWIRRGPLQPATQPRYVLTASIKENLRCLARIVSAGSLPVLIQGETSVGKTSLIRYLAELTGNECLRINNHEHTEIAEYVGNYASDRDGRLVFQEGPLVQAMRRGSWIVLDELNLAASDVLEALNRVLDDNRELFVAETQDTIRAHPHFMLFATQNPPGLYGGRKRLSRALRNRFVELHFQPIPRPELELILQRRCDLPLSRCAKLVEAMHQLQARRKRTGIFQGKDGFVTLRDLFRWAERHRLFTLPDSKQTLFDWDQFLAEQGYLLLAGRARDPTDAADVQSVLESVFRRRLSESELFDLHDKTSPVSKQILTDCRTALANDADAGNDEASHQQLAWTRELRRLCVLLGNCQKFGEPALLVGPTGVGKTTVCQALAEMRRQDLLTLNCHMNTEAADFLGSLRPVRERRIDASEEQQSQPVIPMFEWVDGVLVQAMRRGADLLVDEISLADDSVLERLNSVLEPERELVLAERSRTGDGGNTVEVLKALPEFRLVATMNPGGDFGKKELSPALRNRFTEIWCPQPASLLPIVARNLGQQLAHLAKPMAYLLTEAAKAAPTDDGRLTVSARTALVWVAFVRQRRQADRLPAELAFLHGYQMTCLDPLGDAADQSVTARLLSEAVAQLRSCCLSAGLYTAKSFEAKIVRPFVESAKPGSVLPLTVSVEERQFGIEPFFIDMGQNPQPTPDFSLSAPTPNANCRRLLRALQLPGSRPVLLEGSPGVGKTSLVAALAKASGHRLVRINLSEHTDVADLFGSDLPKEGELGFAWHSGPLLRALQLGHWVVLDEMNLASQSVLEGLNSCLDHRGEIFVPELNRAFTVQSGRTRIFACQNPAREGGGRKCLPRSFVNRFVQVHLTPLTPADQLTVAGAVYAELPLPSDTLESMIRFNCLLQQRVSVDRSFGLAGSPWEFNLRDVFRWCEALRLHGDGGRRRCQPGLFLRLVYSGRMRCREDRRRVADLYREVFPDESANPVYPWPTMLHVTNTHVTVGAARVARQHSVSRISDTTNDEAYLLRHQLGALESLLHCVRFGWPASLIGPEAAGKTRLVRLLAGLCGRRLRVMPLSAGMDTGDLVGGYEQTEPGREGRQLARRARSLARDAARLLSKSRNSAGKTALMLARKALGDAETEQVANESEQTRLLGELLTALEAHCPEELRGRLNTVARQWRELRLSTDSTAASSNGAASVRFRWRDSQLVRAVREGDWLLLDSANHCGVAVLDRLNSLLEPDGRLYLTERGGDIDGDGDEVSPHPEFRLFLASDPKFGELSRAMRNRCAEIWIDPLPPDGAADLVSGLGQSSATKLALRLHCSLTPTPPLTDLLSACRLLLRAADAVDASVKSKTRRKSKRRKLLAPDVVSEEAPAAADRLLRLVLEGVYADRQLSDAAARAVRAAIDAIVDAGCSLSALPTGPVISPPPTPPIRLSELLADPTACLADAGLRLILSLAGPLWLLPTDSGCLATAELYLEWSSARDLPQRLDALAKAFADNQIVSSVFPAADIARLMSSTPAVHSIAAYCRRHDLVDLADPVDVRVLPFVLADAHANADDQSTTSACFAALDRHQLGMRALLTLAEAEARLVMTTNQADASKSESALTAASVMSLKARLVDGKRQRLTRRERAALEPAMTAADALLAACATC